MARSPLVVLLSTLLVTTLAAGDETCTTSEGCTAGNGLKDASSLLQHGARPTVDQRRHLINYVSTFMELPRKMQADLHAALGAKTPEVHETLIRRYLRQAFDLKTGQQKLEAVLAMAEAFKPKDGPVGDHDEKLPTVQLVERWLEREFMAEALFEHAGEVAKLKSKGEAIPDDMAVPPCLKSRLAEGNLDGSSAHGGEETGVTTGSDLPCGSWAEAMEAAGTFFKPGGGYGNFCGKGPKDKTMVSFGKCTGNDTVPSGVMDYMACADSGLDAACAKHDSGAYSEQLEGTPLPACLCQVDLDFKKARIAIGKGSSFTDSDGITEKEAMYTANCIYKFLPCLHWEVRTEGVFEWMGWEKGFVWVEKEEGKYHTEWPMGNPPSGGCGPNGCYRY